jgi:hypothetical protein
MICRDSEGVFLDEKYEVVPAFNRFRDVISPRKYQGKYRKVQCHITSQAPQLRPKSLFSLTKLTHNNVYDHIGCLCRFRGISSLESISLAVSGRNGVDGCCCAGDFGPKSGFLPRRDLLSRTSVDLLRRWTDFSEKE